MVRGSNPRTTCCRVHWLATTTITALATIQTISEVPVGFEPTIYNSFADCAVCPLRHGTSVGWEGFEPPKPVVPDLQSDCFNRLHTNPFDSVREAQECG